MGLAVPVVLGSDESCNGSDDRARTRRSRLTSIGRTPEEHWANRIITVVVVEDDPAMRVLVSFNLETRGFHVVLAENGAEGLEAVAAEQPDLVLLDVMLPDVGGFEVAKRLSDIPIVFMSAKASAADFARGREAGAIDYVAKPFDPVALPDRLREDLLELARGGTPAHVWALRFGSTS